MEKAGLTVDFKAKRDLVFPDELTTLLANDRPFARAFEALTPERQRGDVMHFAAAKQAKARTARIEKCAPKILVGKGLNDR